MIKEYEEKELEPELRPEFLEKLAKIRRGKYTKFNSISEKLKTFASPDAADKIAAVLLASQS